MKVALTFDAELPGREHYDVAATASILDTLDDFGVAATFFVQGRFAKLEPAIVRRMAAKHLIGSHSYFHAPMPLFANIAPDVSLAELAITEACGVDPKPWFRCPFGQTDSIVAERLDALGYRDIGWDLQAADWEPAVPYLQIVDRIVGGVSLVESVVLLHTWPRTTAEALPDILAQLSAMGCQFVTVADLS